MMSHDKIAAAARQRMAQTGEPYASARRAVIREHRAARDRSPSPESEEATWFPLTYRNKGLEKISIWLDRARFGGGPDRAGVEIDADVIRVRGVGSFKLDIPRAAVRSAGRSGFRARGTEGVHEVSRGRWLVNGTASGLVELEISPPLTVGPWLSTGPHEATGEVPHPGPG